MTQTQGVAVTYTGSDTPFVDRIYRSGLTFEQGQSRVVPPTLAERFLRHADVFKLTDAAGDGTAEPQANQSTSTTEPTDTDNTSLLLDDAAKKEAAQRELEEARFTLLDHIDSMDKPALLAYAQDKFNQKLPANMGEVKLRERVKGFVDQYGAP